MEGVIVLRSRGRCADGERGEGPNRMHRPAASRRSRSHTVPPRRPPVATHAAIGPWPDRVSGEIALAWDLLPSAVERETTGDHPMAIAKVIELSSASPESFEDAIRKGIERASKTIENIQGVWVQEQNVKVDGNQISEWRVTMKVTFVLKD